MKIYNKEITVSIFLVFLLHFVLLTYPNFGPYQEIATFLYCLMVFIWAIFKHYPISFFYILCLFFLVVLIFTDLFGDVVFSNNLATIIFELIFFSLIYEVWVLKIKRI